MPEMSIRPEDRNDRLGGGTAAEKGETEGAARSDMGGEGKAGEVPKLEQHSFPARESMPSAAELEALQKQVDEVQKKSG